MKYLLLLAVFSSLSYSLELNGFAETLPDIKDRKIFWNNDSGMVNTSGKRLEYFALNTDNEARNKQKGVAFDDTKYILIMAGAGNRTGIKEGGSLILEGNLDLVKVVDAKGKPVKADKVIGKYNVFYYENNKAIIDGLIAFNNK